MKQLFSEGEIVVWDTEFTSWQGCHMNGWDESKGQYREFVQIGAVVIDAQTFEVKNKFMNFVRPTKNPKLSEYFKELTGIRQKGVDSASDAGIVVKDFLEFVGKRCCYSYGLGDYIVLKESLQHAKVDLKTDEKQFFDVREVFRNGGVAVEKFSSGTITEAFSVKRDVQKHDALADTESILEGLKLMSEKA